MGGESPASPRFHSTMRHPRSSSMILVDAANVYAARRRAPA